MTRDDPTREQRLAEQLRQNLRRRKAQARALDDGPVGGDGSEAGGGALTPPAAPSRS